MDDFLKNIGFWEPDPPPPEPWMPSGEHPPTMAVLLMTGACNLRGIYCYARGGEAPLLQRDVALAQKVIDTAYENAQELGNKKFSLAFHGGGEPTVHWDVLKAAVENAKSLALPCEITMSTNGVWNDVQREFIISNFTGLSLSFDGSREVQDSQRPKKDGSRSFEKLWTLSTLWTKLGFNMVSA